ncbi:recombinase XerD [Xenorhabdus miraniensis]|uniref:Recombinase XerD n=1 Tax=Xenorhabdus miraniensis TaxID=351674 RepID=A0A2D0JJD5_9GAMM|nr:recombinase XerD [Xenorhabdus miraniensis]
MLAEELDTSDAWIFSRTGIQTRHVVGENCTTGDLAVEAAARALSSAGVEQVDAVVLATYRETRLLLPSHCAAYSSFRYHGRMVSYQYDHDKEKQHIRSFFYRLSKECDFAISPHRFRHTLATELMKAPDHNLQLVRSLLGHRSVATTMEYIDIDMEIAGKTLENELAIYLDISV